MVWAGLKKAIGWWQPVLNGFRMRAHKRFHGLRIYFCRVHEPACRTPEPGIILPFRFSLRDRFQPAIVVDGSACVGCPWVAPFLMRIKHHKEQSFRPPRWNRVAQDPGLTAIPAWRPCVSIRIAVKVNVIEGQSLD